MTVVNRFARDGSGASLMEFALVLPVMVALGVGGLELTNLTLAHQKVERLTSTTSDLFARYTTPPNEAQVADTFRAIDALSAPYTIRASGRVIVTGVVGAIDPRSGQVQNKVVWQRCDGSLPGQVSVVGRQWTGSSNFADGPGVTLPNNITLAVGQMAITSEVAFRYTPWFRGRWLGPQLGATPFRERSIQRARGQAYTSITPVNGIAPKTC